MASSETPPPPSPGTGGAVPLAPALLGLLRFVLSSHLAAPDPALPLSPSYCSRLLLDDDDDDLLEKLAAGLARCVEEGRLPVAAAAAEAGIPAGEAWSEEREREWEAVVLEKGNELKRMYDAVEFELHVQEPYFTQLRAGTKKVEGRLAAGNLIFSILPLSSHKDEIIVASEMLQAEMISEVLPGISSIEQGVGVYRKFYTEEKESFYGVLAISVSKPTAQPYIIMTELLAGLGSDGLGRLLGMVKTAGTVQDGLPPPRSVLISSCMKLHQPNVNGCSLTDAARAMAKHVHRSSDGWWGSFHGSDVKKNQLASEIIDHLLRECCWMNIHLTQPYGPVYEIRVHEGYGARWSQDGSKFDPLLYVMLKMKGVRRKAFASYPLAVSSIDGIPPAPLDF
uniref:ASCH domain-containing protein n=1 Tax=Oryza nivara TaxID=4536 RepID=A0A0E0J0I6_ORYNI